MLKNMLVDRNGSADRSVTIRNCVFHWNVKKFYVNSFKVNIVANEEVIPRSEIVFRLIRINIKI